MVMFDEKRPDVGCVVMAAGNADRFGGGKLAAVFRGKTLLERALEAVPADRLTAVCVVVRDDTGEAAARRIGFDAVRNSYPERGAAYSVRLGTEALKEKCGAILFQAADQPLLRRETVADLIDLYLENPDSIAALAHDGVRGNPCIFPAEFFPELCALTGDVGGSAVIRRHPDRLLLLEADTEELADVDTREDLQQLQR